MGRVQVCNTLYFNDDRALYDEVGLESILEFHSLELEGNEFFSFRIQSGPNQVSNEHALVNRFHEPRAQFLINSITGMNNCTRHEIEIGHGPAGSVAPLAPVLSVFLCENNALTSGTNP